MNVGQRILVMVALTLAAIPLAAQTGTTPDEREENRRKLERLKDQPEAMARVRRQALFFLGLPEDRKAHLLDFDQKLHKEPMATRKRLEKVLERYAAWLESLNPADRKKINDAPDSKSRLEIIKKIRSDEWLKKQPCVIQEEVGKLDEDQRLQKIHALREKERKQKIHWLISSRFWDDLSKGRPLPVRLKDFDGDITTFFNEYLLPRLGPKEKAKLKEAEGQWPQFPMVLVALADRHPPALPDENRWPRNFKELPRDVQKRIYKGKDNTKKIPGKFFLQVNKEGLARAASHWTKNPLPHELWPKNKSCLTEPVKKFISTKLEPLLASDEFVKMNKAEEKGWPSFPLMLKKLAEDHDLQVPWHTLPGNPELWDKYRLKRLLEKP